MNAAALQAAVARTSARRDEWARLEIPGRVALIDRLLRDTRACAETWVRAACAAKGLYFDAPEAAEEWLGGPVTVLRNLRLLRRSLMEIQRYGKPRLAADAVSATADGRVTVRVHPASIAEGLLLQGFSAEVRMLPGVTVETLPDVTATRYPVDPRASGRTCAVLGAGNVASIGPMDVLSKLYIEGAVCVLKTSPVNEYLAPHVERAFAALVERGYLTILTGDSDLGAELVHHQAIDEVHVTGSTRVHDRIVWGEEGAEQARNRSAGTPVLQKPITSELGCVTPVIVAPGQWTRAELAFQAASIASQVVNNASFNCNAAKVLVTSAGWAQRDQLLDRIEAVLRATHPRRAYYPGSEARYETWCAAHEPRTFGARTAAALPWALARGADPASQAHGFRNEAWCGVLLETALPEADPENFLAAAVRFCNDRLWGTLSCSLVVDPRTQREAHSAVERAIAGLRYGSVVINHWPGIAYGLASPPWGAYPGHTLDDVQSGIGVVHDTALLARTEKTIVRGPFLARPAPPWFVTHRRAHDVARRMVGYEATGRITALPALAWAALRG